MDAAIAHCTKGAGIWDWVSNEQGAEPDGYIFYATERRFMVRWELTGGELVTLSASRYGKWEDKTVDFVESITGTIISTGWLNRPAIRLPEVRPR
jgi:hypothetical protein